MTFTSDQQHAVDVFMSFRRETDPRSAMILRGSAGTGKTTIVAHLVATFAASGRKVVLLAPTGRAAKVLAMSTGRPASTIHRKIYRQQAAMGDFNLDGNRHSDTLFVVDEASMINTQHQEPTAGMPRFGKNGGVIDDLISYVYSGHNCRLLLVGDTAQLPPIGEDEAPALQALTLQGYGLTVYQCDLAEVVRQAQESGILWNATRIRQMITHDDITQLPRVRFDGFADIRRLPGDELIDSLANSYHNCGEDDTMVVVRSNKTAGIYNNGIRARVVDREEELTAGDRVMIVKNHYFDEPNPPLPFIANGDVAVVKRVRNKRDFYGFHFADLTLRFPDYNDVEIERTAILDTLQSPAPALTADERTHLFNEVLKDYQHLPTHTQQVKAAARDPYYTALQIKFAYAVTCHKAQGGQWSHVYIDQGYMTDDMLTPDYVHWLYTAFTRATQTLFLVNWPKTQIEGDTEED